MKRIMKVVSIDKNLYFLYYLNKYFQGLYIFTYYILRKYFRNANKGFIG